MESVADALAKDREKAITFYCPSVLLTRLAVGLESLSIPGAAGAPFAP
jgi:hypothetical protein